MKLTLKIKQVWQGFRRDGSRVTVQGPAYRFKHVWQVNHGHTYERKRNWFETKKEALAFAVKGALQVHEWEEIFVVCYPENGAIRVGGKLLGHKQAEKS